jgi:hypothetical protein
LSLALCLCLSCLGLTLDRLCLSCLCLGHLCGLLSRLLSGLQLLLSLNTFLRCLSSSHLGLSYLTLSLRLCQSCLRLGSLRLRCLKLRLCLDHCLDLRTRLDLGSLELSCLGSSLCLHLSCLRLSHLSLSLDCLRLGGLEL